MCPLDRVLTYKNLIYLLNLQFYCVNTSYPMDNLLNNYHLVGGKVTRDICELIIANFNLRSRLTLSGDSPYRAQLVKLRVSPSHTLQIELCEGIM